MVFVVGYTYCSFECVLFFQVIAFLVSASVMCWFMGGKNVCLWVVVFDTCCKHLPINTECVCVRACVFPQL
jgi:hypothetical protein